jgi:hypothetical protein
MAWSPIRRANAGSFEVGHPGDYATPNSNQPRDGTREQQRGGHLPPCLRQPQATQITSIQCSFRRWRFVPFGRDTEI